MKYNGNEPSVKDINCDEAIKRLMDFLDDYLNHQRKSELEKHLASCSSCMNRYEFQKNLKTKISSLADQSDPSLSKRLKKLFDSV
jgi:anti-sigma factor (TIGR02949 family)